MAPAAAVVACAVVGWAARAQPPRAAVRREAAAICSVAREAGSFFFESGREGKGFFELKLKKRKKEKKKERKRETKR
jgi:hypothetical protein